jgi:uncharacterized repeat protein (TIGR01451 family)
LKSVAAALFAVLLPFGVPQEGASAQDNPGSGAVTITNIAEASWELGGERLAVRSNPVSFEVDSAPSLPLQLRVFRRAGAEGIDLSYRAPSCISIGPEEGSAKVAAEAHAAGRAPSVVSQTVIPATQFRGGEPLFFEITAAPANRDPAEIDSLAVELTTTAGDRETVTVFETAANSGVFSGVINTRRIPPPLVIGDCRLSADDGALVSVAAMHPENGSVLIEAEFEMLVDRLPVVFDSETGEPVDGARVTLVDAATGAPATILAQDGVTAWPSSVVSGSPVTDGAGRTTSMGPGEFWFPLSATGTYRLRVEPPEPYTAPSRVAREVLASLPRPDGRGLVINEGSFGDAITLDALAPVEIDIPLDRPSLDLALGKTASRASAAPGDVVFYTLTLRNLDPTRIKRAVTISDTPSRWLRLRPDSVKINGEAVPDAVTFAPDGRTLTIALGDLAGGASARVTYAVSVRPDAPPGPALNEALARDALGRLARASAAIEIEREGIADRMTIVGRITAGDCRIDESERRGIGGVRVMLEDGSFAVTDAEGRYHFEGVVPGTHVVQVSRMTLPGGARMIDCHRSTRNAGSAYSRFAIGQGGSLVVADFHAVLPEAAEADATDEAAMVGEAGEPDRSAAAAVSDWLSLGDGEDGFLAPAIDANPRAPAVRVVVRHRRGQTVELLVDGKPVDPLAFDGTQNPERGKYAVSQWRGVPLINERTMLEARIRNSFGEISNTFTREVTFTSAPARVEFLPELSNLVADGRTKPVIAIRVLDRNDRPLREGISGEFRLGAPYESAEQIDRQQLDQLTSTAPVGARWMIEGEGGIARIELAPTMVSGSVRLDFAFDDGQVVRRQEVEAWIEPGDIEWTIVGLIEGTAGARSVADNMERAGRFDSDLGEDARVALYAKGRILGKYLLTLAYDSAKQREDQRVLGALDPQAYYTVFADASARRFDAASREKLYVRIETFTFYALYGDFQTAFNQTRLANYNRTATGVKGEGRFGAVKAQGFAAEIASRFRRQEIQGQGITGPYELSSRRILANSERVTIEVRDRFRPELIVSVRELTRFADYDLDLLAGTIRFARPVLSRDENLNPQFIIIEFETDGAAQGELNAGVRADWTSADGAVRIGASAITDAGLDQPGRETARTQIGAIDLLARLDDSTEIRAELGVSRRDSDSATGWLVEAQHQTGTLDLLAYARQIDADYGIGQQNAAELGRRKLGVDGRVLLNQELSLVGSLWQDESLIDAARRRAAQAQLSLTRQRTDLRIGIAHFTDRLSDGSNAASTVLEAGATQRLFDNRLEISGSTAVALDRAESLDLPARHRASVRYAITQDVRLVGTYEIADGETLDARQLRGGIELSPWRGGQVVATLGEESIAELGTRSFAAFGVSQSLQVTPELLIDATIDGNRSLGGAPDPDRVINPAQPAASGGQLTGGLLFEDFTALTFGAAWRKDRWSVTGRGEFRDGEQADRKGLTLGAIRQLGEGSLVGAGGTWTRAETPGNASSEIMDASIAFAHRPAESPLAMLGRLEYRSDRVENAVAGETGGAGRSALIVDGDATARRLVASLSTNLSPRGRREGYEVRRDEYGLFFGARHNFDDFEGTEFSGTALLAGVDARIGLGEYFEVGASATLRTNLEDNVTSFALGPTLGIVPVEGMLMTLGYNLSGFRDGDFSAARNTDEGVFLGVRMKLDTDTFSFLGLGDRQ